MGHSGRLNAMFREQDSVPPRRDLHNISFYPLCPRHNSQNIETSEPMLTIFFLVEQEHDLGNSWS